MSFKSTGGIGLGFYLKQYEAKAFMDHLLSKDFARFKRNSLKEIGKFARKELTRDISKQMGSLQTHTKRKITLQVKTIGLNQSAIVTSTGGPLPLRSFKPRQSRAGVTATAWGKSKLYPRLFVRPGKMGGHVFKTIKGVKTRSGRPRIKKTWGPGIAKEAADTNLQRDLYSNVVKRLPVIMDREYSRMVRGIGLGRIK